jgi:hypothetical protein
MTDAIEIGVLAGDGGLDRGDLAATLGNVARSRRSDPCVAIRASERARGVA